MEARSTSVGGNLSVGTSVLEEKAHCVQHAVLLRGRAEGGLRGLRTAHRGDAGAAPATSTSTRTCAKPRSRRSRHPTSGQSCRRQGKSSQGGGRRGLFRQPREPARRARLVAALAKEPEVGDPGRDAGVPGGLRGRRGRAHLGAHHEYDRGVPKNAAALAGAAPSDRNAPTTRISARNTKPFATNKPPRTKSSISSPSAWAVCCSRSKHLLPTIEPLLAQYVAPMLAPDRSPEERRIAVCVFDDVFEHASENGASLRCRRVRRAVPRRVRGRGRGRAAGFGVRRGRDGRVSGCRVRVARPGRARGARARHPGAGRAERGENLNATESRLRAGEAVRVAAGRHSKRGRRRAAVAFVPPPARGHRGGARRARAARAHARGGRPAPAGREQRAPGEGCQSFRRRRAHRRALGEAAAVHEETAGKMRDILRQMQGAMGDALGAAFASLAPEEQAALQRVMA